MGAEKLGEYLRRERELRGITLEEISQGTKISKRLLEYMETGRWDELPGEIFAKGFLKSYAEFIGLSTEEILLRYEEEKLLDQEELNSVPETGPKGSPKNAFLFLACLMLAIVIGYLSYMIIQKGPWVEPKNPVKKQQITSSIEATNTAQGINGSTPSSGNTTQDGETHRE